MSASYYIWPLGTRVRLSALGRKALGTRMTDRRLGTVSGGCTADQALVKVLWDGLVSPQNIHRDFLEAATR